MLACCIIFFDFAAIINYKLIHYQDADKAIIGGGIDLLSIIVKLG
ncbi:hypothetical protein SOVF_060280 [Spinacia oleracea]|nr:hypothetical protein SOVF_060280 [Spinacia oleracea]